MVDGYFCTRLFITSKRLFLGRLSTRTQCSHVLKDGQREHITLAYVLHAGGTLLPTSFTLSLSGRSYNIQISVASAIFFGACDFLSKLCIECGMST